MLTIPVTLSDGSSFSEQTHTFAINAHGALVTLSAPVSLGQELRVTNRMTSEEQRCKVTLDAGGGAKINVGIELLNPSPQFWGVSFPSESLVK